MRTRTTTVLASFILLFGSASPAAAAAQPARATLTASARVVDASAGAAAVRAAESMLHAAADRGEATAAGSLVRITVVEESRRGARVVEIAFVGN